MELTSGLPAWDPGRVAERNKVRALLRLVRLEHTLFSLPFAYAGALLSGYGLTGKDAVLIALAVLGLRSAGMSFNNIADLDIDRENPRSKNRPLVTGAVSIREAWLVALIGSALYFASAAMLNPYALALSPLLWAIVITYPYAKRVHWIPHLHLGLALGMVVFGGAIAASGDSVSSLVEALKTVPYVYVAAVTLWVAGFDVIYSIMDLDFDRRADLGSIPARLGIGGALLSALLMHALSVALLLAGCLIYNLGLLGIAATTLGALVIAYQHVLVRRGLSNIPKAFNLNLAVSIIISVGVVLDGILS
uniref:4-hydroxybenzoate octaprenyltransferase n=1 Tax=Fervidicoccus fontis TaxID=683846 RepID=A0A7J3ZIR2_9CREN